MDPPFQERQLWHTAFAMNVPFITPVPERRSTSISGAYFGSFCPVAILGENVISMSLLILGWELGWWQYNGEGTHWTSYD
jgi:hypothetical protein